MTGSRASWIPVAITALVAPALYVRRFGYAFGYSDQDEFLPWLLQRLEPDFLANDWFVGIQAGSFNVRSGFVGLMEPLAATVGIEAAVAILYGICWLILGVAIHILAQRWTRSPAVAALTTVAILVAIPRWTLGGNALVAGMLVPSMLAWSLGVAALALLGRTCSVFSGVLLGLTAWIQPLVAVTIGVPAFAATVAAETSAGSRGRRVPVLCLSIPALVIALPFAALLLLDLGLSASSGDTPGLLDVMVELRAPHHFSPAAFPLFDWIQFVLLAVAGGFALRRLRSEVSRAIVRQATVMLGIAALFVLVGLASHLEPRLAVLQPFKITVLAALLLSLAVGGLVASFSRRVVPGALKVADRFVSHPAAAVLATVTAVALVWSVGTSEVPDRGMARAADHVRADRGPVGLTAVPPSTTGFRFRSRNGVLVTFKAVPFSGPDMAAWYRRLSDVAPVLHLVRPGTPARLTLEALDASWESLSRASLDSLAARYGIAWVVRRTPMNESVPWWNPVLREDGIILYRREDPEA